MLQILRKQVLFSRLSWEGEGYSLAAQVHYADSDSGTTQPPHGRTMEVEAPFGTMKSLGDQAVQTWLWTLRQAFGMDFNQNGIPDVSNVFIGRSGER